MVFGIWDLRGIFWGDLGVKLFRIWDLGENIWDLRLINYYFLSYLYRSNIGKFNYYIDGIYPEELGIKDTKLYIYPKWANYLDLRLGFDEHGKLCTRLYD